MTIQEGLSSLGFTKSEIAAYLSLAEMGKAQANLIAKKARISRTTVYPILYKLVDLGLVSLEKKKDTAFFVANPPKSLLDLVLTEKAKLSEREQKTKDIIQALLPLFKSRNFSMPKFQFFDGAGNIRSMLDQFLPIWLESMKANDDTLWGYQDPTFVEQYRDWLEKYWALKGPNHQIKLFSNERPVEKKLKQLVSKREVRVLDISSELISSLWVSGNYITLLMTRQQPYYAFQIEDAVFSSTLRSVFACLWAATGK